MKISLTDNQSIQIEGLGEGGLHGYARVTVEDGLVELGRNRKSVIDLKPEEAAAVAAALNNLSKQRGK